MERVWIAKGYPCLVYMGNDGYRRGYVGVSPSHPYYRKLFYNLGVGVHGGLSFSNFNDWLEREVGKVFPGASYLFSNRWWLGFGCTGEYDAPVFDKIKRDSLRESQQRYWADRVGVVKTLSFCIDQCHHLITQFRQVEGIKEEPKEWRKVRVIRV